MNLLNSLLNKFRDRDYRRVYVDEFTHAYLATQIQVLREQRELSQKELAQLVGVKQSQISRFENVNNTSWQGRTLRNLAAAFDLVLVTKFESFGAVLRDIDSFGREALERPSFEDDPIFACPTLDLPKDYADDVTPSKVAIQAKVSVNLNTFRLVEPKVA